MFDFTDRFQKSISFRFLTYFLLAGVAPLFLFLIVIVLVTMGTNEPLSFENFSLLSPFYRLVLFVILISLTTMLGVYWVHRKVSDSLMQPISKINQKNREMLAGQLEKSLISEGEIPPDEIGETMRVRNEMIRRLIADEEALVRKEKFAAIGQLASFIAHDLRTPLATLHNAASNLESFTGSEGTKEIEKQISAIKRQVAVANQIMNNLLDFTREAKPVLAKFSLHALLTETVDEISLPKNISISWRLPRESFKVCGDPIQIRQVFSNLLLNAIQAMPEGGSIEVSASPKDQMMEVHLKDSGGGIHPAILDKIFQPLFSTKEYGTGLGLAISKQLIEKNGGEIFVRSQPGKGSDFSITLPLAA